VTEQIGLDRLTGLIAFARVASLGSFRDLICLDPQSGGGWASYWGNEALVLRDASLGFRGSLQIICVPKGSTWELTLSDVPVVRQPSTPLHNFVGVNHVPVNPPASPKVSDKARATERQLAPRQLNNSRRSAANRPA
jgi:hypothetical protein